MATAAHTTRRALFAAAPIVALAGPAAASGHSCPLDMWREYRLLETRINASDECDADCVRFCGLEEAILACPVNSMDDALAILCVVGVTAERGQRADEADARAYQRVIAWMERR